ncbi:MAG: TRAP transporter substrate-binding protein [Burkholderiales bacterium]|nr:TRAP transporter substrate-binding protein [Burkholderiales bacterium]
MKRGKERGPDAKTGGRRKFLRGAAVAGGTAALAVTAGCGLGGSSQPQAQSGAGGALGPQLDLRFQAGFPSKDLFYELSEMMIRTVSDLSGGQIRIQLLPAGAVVGAFDMADAVHKGILDGCVAVPAFWYGKDYALSLFGTGPALGQDANTLLAWMEFGGGKALYEELYRDVLKLDVVPILWGPMGTQPFGWFKQELRSVAGVKGLKYRTVGLSIDLYTEMGASVVALAGGEIVPALERGVIDAAEYNNPASDQALGFPDVAKVCMVKSYHQPGECLELLISKRTYDAMPPAYQQIFRYAAKAASAEMGWRNLDAYSKAWEEMRDKQGVRFVETPKDVLGAQLEAWDKVMTAKSAGNPFFAKVLESQRAFMKRAVGYQVKFANDPRQAYEHFFGTV